VYPNMKEVNCALWALMEAHSPPLHALIVPSEDANQSEYVAARDKRSEYVSGFTGSVVLTLITRNESSVLNTCHSK